MNFIELKAYAKVNLSLDVLNRMENGYHEVEMIMQQITLYDDIKIIKKEENVTLECNFKYIPSDDKNIAMKIAKDILRRFNITSGIHIIIFKRIPVAAGLAGGSADAAAVIKGLNILFDLKMTKQEMKDISVSHGADIPFCIEGGAAVASGIGEKLETIKSLNDVWMILYKPSISVSTQKIYDKLDVDKIKKHPNTKFLLNQINNGQYRELARNMYNVLEEITSNEYSIIKKIETKMKEYGAIGSMMSGSGPTVFGIYKNYKSANQAFNNFKKKNKNVFLVKSYDGGKNDE